MPSHFFMLNLAFEWMLLLLLRPFYQPPLTKTEADDANEPLPHPHPHRHGEDLRKISRLANEECPKSATRVLELLCAYDKLFTLRLCPVTNVQIAYHAGKTCLTTVFAGGCPGSGKKQVQAGLKARDKVRECVSHLKKIGESWASGIVTADMLEKELEGEIERQDKRAPTSSPKNVFVQALGMGQGSTSATRGSVSMSPKALVSPK